MLRNAASKVWAVQLRTSASSTAASGASENVSLDSGRGNKRIGRALEIYLRNAKSHAAMMARERADFEQGRRHLASMMGLDIHSLTQQDVDSAVEYLFPSGLTSSLAKPVMRPPDEILPKAFHRFTFDDEGRPEGTRFYTLYPKFYDLLSEVGMKTHSVVKYHNQYMLKGESADNKKYFESVNLSGSTWLSEDEFEKLKYEGEKVKPEMFTSLIMALEYLCSLPGSQMEAEFINQHRKPLTSTLGTNIFGPQIPQVQIDPESNRRFTTVTVRCKDTMAEVTTYDAGTGKFDVNGIKLYDFRHLQARYIVSDFFFKYINFLKSLCCSYTMHFKYLIIFFFIYITDQG
ncbi:hypothetical protein WR25_14065 [Diploscapter pachys]|uniref:28S ribosomal protein S9, mitochondrial n=1 Tax=Diploscapter pachys TaxID=2018661 RepID=A0A2A2J5V6_9BILA|nr:hypothetical protein WR25_14065 [Diploscapter pachys]